MKASTTTVAAALVAVVAAKKSATTDAFTDWSAASTTPVDPVQPTTSSWSDWSATTTTIPVDPAKSSTTWADWSSTSVVDPAKSSTTWADWSSTSVVDPAKSSTTWAEWSSTSVVDPAKSSTTWAEWSSKPTTPVEPAKPSSSSWSDWDTATTTVTATYTNTVTVTVQPAKASSTGQIGVYSSNGWFGPTWDGQQCTVVTLTSYSVVSAPATSSSAWSTWASTTSTSPVAPASPSTSTWASWASTSSSPVSPTSPSTSGWGQWQPQTTGGMTTNGNQWGMTYSPYTNDSGCKDQSTIASDIQKIASLGFTTVRVYSTQCNTLEYVGDACKQNNMKMILGVFIDDTGVNSDAAKQQVTDICNWAQWDLVELVVIGNEAVSSGYCSAQDLAGFISSSKSAFQAAGYKGACTTTEELDQWQSNGDAWCDVVDVVSANLYAFFNAQTTADQAGQFIQSEIDILSAICSGKETYVMETGWPHAGDCNGVACPSPENQATAIKGIQDTCGAKVIFFSFEDEAWKPAGPYNVEQYWGCASVF